MDYDSRIHQPGQSRINPCLPDVVPKRTSGNVCLYPSLISAPQRLPPEPKWWGEARGSHFQDALPEGTVPHLLHSGMLGVRDEARDFLEV